MDLPNLTYRALRRLRLQTFLNWNASIPGTGIRVPLLGQHLGQAVMLYAETWKSDALRKITAAWPVSMVLDVGANEGQTILDLARAGLGGLETLAFEPNPACAHYLERLIRTNGWTHVTLFPFALSDRARCLPLECASDNDAGASLVPALRPGLRILRRQLVPCFSLDALATDRAIELKPRFLLKIDVEGAELDVLTGSRETLCNLRPIVLCEVLWAHCEERLSFMRERNRSLVKLLRDSGYEVHRLALSSDGRAVDGLEPLSEFPSGVYSPRNAHLCEYLFVPQEHSEVLHRQFGSAAPA